jgi:hypothetical protein
MSRYVITVPQGAFAKYRPTMLRCARCDGEFPVTSEDDKFIYVSCWLEREKFYCSEEHANLDRHDSAEMPSPRTHPHEERQMYYFIRGKEYFATIGKKVRNIHEALSEARYMFQRGMTNISIQDNAGHTIDGSDLLACVKGEKVLSDDLRAHYVS